MATIRICNVEGCQSKHAARGYCKRHYNATPALGKASTARWRQTPAGKASRKATRARYNATAKEQGVRVLRSSRKSA